MKKLLKYFLIFLSLIIVLVVIALFSLSPVAKYLINKNCVKWTGRHITAGGVNLNPFNGTVFIKDLKIYEADSIHIFFECHDIAVKLDLKKAMHKIYEVNEIRIDGPEINVEQNKSHFNFDDLIKRFASDTTKQPKPKDTAQIHYFIHNVSINNASINYNNIAIHNIFKIHELNVKLPELSWNDPKAKVHVDFNYGTGGAFNIDLATNLKTLDYNLSLIIDKYDLSQYHAPLNAYIRISSLKGFLNTKMRIHGKFNNPENFSMFCNLNIQDLEIKDMDKRKILAMKEFSTYVDTINMKENRFILKHILFDKPYVAFDELGKGNNFSMSLVEHKETEKEIKEAKAKEELEAKKDTGKAKRDYSNIFAFLQSSMQNSAADFLGASYQVDTIAIRDGEFVFNDNTPPYIFHYKVSKINVLTDEMGMRDKQVLFKASAMLDDTGSFAMKASVGYDLKKKLFSYKISELDIPDISPLAKYLLENNSLKWTGRQITTGNIKLDPLKGSVLIKDIKIYEPDTTNVFFDCHDVYLQVNLTEMADNVYEVDNVRIDNPEINIAQNGNSFNFDDLTKRFSSTDTSQSKGPQIHYDIKNVAINNGDITYNNVPIHNIFKIHELNFKLPELSWNNPVSRLHLDFNYGTSGFINADMDINRNTQRYNLSLSVDKYDLSQYYAPLNSVLAISSLKGEFSTQLSLHGRFNSPKDISGTGYIHINDLEIKDTAKEKVFALNELALDIDSVNVKQGMYALNNVLLDRPYIKFDYYPNGNNISQMIKYTAPPSPVKDTSTGQVKPDYSNIFTLLSSSIKMMAVDFVNTNYHTDSVIIRNGQFVYNDYTLNDLFHYNITNLNVTTDKISSAKKSLQFNLEATLNDTGKIVMVADMGLDMKNMLLNYEITNLRISDFNPYSEYYIGTPFEDGYMHYQSTDSVINRILKSSNAIHIENVKIGKKSETKPVYHLPVRMAVSLLKDEKDNIDIKIPANGNLDDPKYKIGPLVGHVTSELIVKTAESPFRLLGKLFHKDPEELRHFTFDYMQDQLTTKQLDRLDNVYKVLEKKKVMDVELIQIADSTAEKDDLALFTAKKAYFEETHHIVNDSLLTRRKRKKELHAEEKIATQDTLFDKWLNQKLHLTGSELLTIDDKCIQLVGDSLLSHDVHRRREDRNEEVYQFLVKKKEVDPKRVKVVLNKEAAKVENLVDPEFEIKYSAGDK